LRSDELRTEIDKMQADAKTVGLKGVPVVVIDGKWVVSGTQRSEFYVQVNCLAPLSQDPLVLMIRLLRSSGRC
jgi:predicted DsbA family dithiol-disulfide isomerase